MNPKPTLCSTCSFQHYGAGFVPALIHPESKVYVIHEQPSKTDTMKGLPLQDWFGEAFMELVARPLGVGREVFAFDHALRCKTASGLWPDGKRLEAARDGCRRWDSGVHQWKPTLAIPSYSIQDVRFQPTTVRLIQSAFEKAFRFVEKGERPVVVCGLGAVKVYFPDLPLTQEWKKKSFLATWQGSYHREGLWKTPGKSNATGGGASTVGTSSNPSIDMIIDRVRAGQ